MSYGNDSSLWKRLWTFRKTDYIMVVVVVVVVISSGGGGGGGGDHHHHLIRLRYVI
jgi:hypothetical protein